MDPEQGQLSVWICREEKLVSGLTRRTTCGDVVRVLLDDLDLQRTGMLSGPPDSYRVVEKWRGFERTLPDNTRLLQLWSAWGAERHDVRFVLVRNDASLPSNSPRTAEARVVPSRDGGAPGSLLKGSGSAVSVSQDKQRRVVRKAFRKLDKMNRKREKKRGSVERMETLVHLVVSQDHTIRQQVRRICELDREIERYEAGVHRDRVRRHGANYVQDTYLVEGSNSGERRDARCAVETNDARTGEMHDARCAPEDAHDARCASADALAQLEEYARRCEEVMLLQEELTEREALVETVTMEIQEELNQRWMKRRAEEAEADKLVMEGEEEEEEERIRTQLDASLYVGLRLKADLDDVRADLDRSLALWETQERELLDLLARVETMEPEAGGGWVEQARGLPGTNDEDSDTGMSSMNSQDSDSTPVCESLV